MFPLFPFFTGLLAGTVAVNLWRRDETKAGVMKAREGLRSATAKGLGSIEAAAGQLRGRLEEAPGTPPQPAQGTAEAGATAAPAQPSGPHAQAPRPTEGPGPPRKATPRKRALRKSSPSP